METLELLGAALGLATLAGINLYLTVFVTGLAINAGWITLHHQYEHLAVLGDPVIVTVAGILFFLEFFADKVPWVDSLWDSIHTLIRPIGGAMLAITVLGEMNPVYDVLVGLLAGGMALTTHGAKAGTRLLVNASPEPFSNVGLSVAEDVLVLGGLALTYNHPIVALVVAVVAVGLLLWFAPRLFGAARAMLWFLWRRFRHATGGSTDATPPALPAELEIALAEQGAGDAPVAWAAPCVSGGGEAVRRNSFGWLLFTGEGDRTLTFARRADTRPELVSLPLAGRKALHRRGFVADRVVIYQPGGSKQTFQFDRSRRPLAERLVELVNAPGPRAAALVAPAGAAA